MTQITCLELDDNDPIRRHVRSKAIDTTSHTAPTSSSCSRFSGASPECLAIIDKYHDPLNKYVFDFILQDRYDVDDKMINALTSAY